MTNKLNYVVERITQLNPLHSKKIRSNIESFDGEYFSKADEFLDKFVDLLKDEGKDLDYAIDCYLKMIADVYYESVRFVQTGQYTSTSFKEVNERVYNDPGVMEYYMYGLLMSQFLWRQHYEILLYFREVMNENKAHIRRYLEVGGGHGLYISEAINILGDNCEFDLVDISESSLNIAKKMIGNDAVNYYLTDVFDYYPDHKYDFITMGEVLEHVEDPVSLLKKLHSLAKDDGKVYITTPTNAPAIDHIYLFKNADDIREVIDKAGFNIEKDYCIWSEDLPPDLLEKHKISMMYLGVLTKK